ncbi:hypothetical protein ACS0TY_004737 [Phlomoides rotata]
MGEGRGAAAAGDGGGEGSRGGRGGGGEAAAGKEGRGGGTRPKFRKKEKKRERGRRGRKKKKEGGFHYAICNRGADIFKVFSWLMIVVGTRTKDQASRGQCNFLKCQKNKLDTSILDIQVAIVKHHTTSSSKEEENDDPAHVDSKEETLQHILMYKKFAAALLCKMTS